MTKESWTAVLGIAAIILFIVGVLAYIVGDLTSARVFGVVGLISFVVAVYLTPNRRYPK